MKLHKLIEEHWYKKTNLFLTLIFVIPTIIFFLISKIRYYFYRFNILKSYKLPIPVVVIGNISVGGVGKTPLTKMLAIKLAQDGKKVGIILRGYKGQNQHACLVSAKDNSLDVGDEALIYALNGLKVAIGSNRYMAGLKLLEAYPDLDIILADDGLQHYRLKRDFEIAVVDGSRMFRKNFVLPMGPYRETSSRLKTVDAIVITNQVNSKQLDQYSPKTYTQKIVFDKIYNPIQNLEATPDYFYDKKTIAIAAIGNPGRFFDLLHSIGIKPLQRLIYPDHYHYKISDIPQNYLVLVTEKDYTKLAKFNNANIYIVLVKACLDSNHLYESILRLIK